MLSPLFATLFSFCILGEPLYLSFIVATVFSLLGLILIAQPESIFGSASSSNPNSLLGVTFALCGALSAGGAYVFVRYLGTTGIPWYNVTFVQSFGQIFLVFPSMWIYTRGNIVAWENQNLIWVLLGGTIGAISQSAMTVGMQRESSARATSMRMSDVLFGYIFQFYLTKSDKLSVTSLFGAILITSSIIIVMYFKPQKNNTTNNIVTDEANKTSNTNRNDVKSNNDTENPIIEMIQQTKKVKYTSLQQNEDEDKERD
jgi:drug/metabolite transporter (DMT)-like permease